MESARYFPALAILSAILLLAPLRSGDLNGYDDAQYAHIAKDIVRSGDWIVISSNGEPALENPPMLEWIEAALFSVFGFSDSLARLPSALCGLGTILLVYWLARRLTGDTLTATLAMLVMATSLYFLKYAARGMTDVPFTFFLLCGVCAWTLAAADPRWYLAAGACTACAQMTRSIMGLLLPAIFALDLLLRRRRPPFRFVVPALVIAYLPLVAWYAWLVHLFGAFFVAVHSTWLRNEVYGPLQPAWRRYTGLFEYAWMLAKSYWPWLPVMLAGIAAVWRGHNPSLRILLPWAAVVFVLCAAARSRVLRYLLPAYPAFAILAAIGLASLVSAVYLRKALRIAVPCLALAACAHAAFPLPHLTATEIRPLAAAATAATAPNERVGFYDGGQPRYDEANQIEWYGDRFLLLALRPDALPAALRRHQTSVWIVDQATYRTTFQPLPHEVLCANGHLLCIRLK